MSKPSFDNLEFVFSALYEAFYENVESEEERDLADQKFDASWSSFLVMAGWTHEEFDAACDENQDDDVCDSCKKSEETEVKKSVN